MSFQYYIFFFFPGCSGQDDSLKIEGISAALFVIEINQEMLPGQFYKKKRSNEADLQN